MQGLRQVTPQCQTTFPEQVRSDVPQNTTGPPEAGSSAVVTCAQIAFLTDHNAAYTAARAVLLQEIDTSARNGESYNNNLMVHAAPHWTWGQE